MPRSDTISVRASRLRVEFPLVAKVRSYGGAGLNDRHEPKFVGWRWLWQIKK